MINVSRLTPVAVGRMIRALMVCEHEIGDVLQGSTQLTKESLAGLQDAYDAAHGAIRDAMSDPAP